MAAFYVLDVPQRSPEWYAARLGRLTGSCADKMLATIKSGEAAARRDLRTRLVVERLTGQSQESGFLNDDMQWGIDQEDFAIAAYEAHTGASVTRAGFLEHAAVMAGCSLDGHLGAFQTLVSVKCPRSANHFKNLRASEVPPEYVPQMLHECWLTGARQYHFVSWDPRFPEQLRLKVIRRDVTDAEIDAYERKALAFLVEVDAEMEAVQTISDLHGQLVAASDARRGTP